VAPIDKHAHVPVIVDPIVANGNMIRISPDAIVALPHFKSVENHPLTTPGNSQIPDLHTPGAEFRFLGWVEGSIGDRLRLRTAGSNHQPKVLSGVRFGFRIGSRLDENGIAWLGSVGGRLQTIILSTPILGNDNCPCVRGSTWGIGTTSITIDGSRVEHKIEGGDGKL
jgi:hypothetical protein